MKLYLWENHYKRKRENLNYSIYMDGIPLIDNDRLHMKFLKNLSSK